MIIDEPIPNEMIRSYSKTASEMPDFVNEEYDKLFKGNMSDDFYRGLVKGLAIAKILDNQLSIVICYVSRKMEQKEII